MKKTICALFAAIIIVSTSIFADTLTPGASRQEQSAVLGWATGCVCLKAGISAAKVQSESYGKYTAYEWHILATKTIAKETTLCTDYRSNPGLAVYYLKIVNIGQSNIEVVSDRKKGGGCGNYLNMVI